MHIHNHTEAVSTWSHVVHVKKKDYLTLKQAKKTIATTRRACFSCSLVSPLKLPRPHKEKNKV